MSATRTNQPGARAKEVRTGSVSLLLTDVAKAVVFSTPMPGASYHVTFESDAGLAASFGVGSKTANGFNTLSIGIAATLNYRATEN